MLNDRFRRSQTLTGTQKIYCVIPASNKPEQAEVISEAQLFNITYIGNALAR
jgi:hypothetical protein